jgi:hypothetical protein
MSKFLQNLYERKWATRWGPTSMLTAFMLFTMELASYAQTTLVQIGAGGPTSSGGFENAAPTGVPSADFAANNWTVAQSGTTNRWWVGTAGTPAAGAYHAFQGPDGSTFATSTGATWNHMYRDITIPSGESILTVSFRARYTGGLDCATPPTIWDAIEVRSGPTSLTPTAGFQYTGIGTAQVGLTCATGTYTNYSFSTVVTPGTTIRLCISARSDGVTPHTAFALDDIQVQSSVPSTFNATAQGGLWNSPATWAGGVVPGPGNDVVIPAGSTVVVNQNITYRDLTVSGNLRWSGTFASTISRNVQVNAGGNINMLSTAGIGQELLIGGDLTNNGTIDAYFGTITFNGTSNSQITGTGTFTPVAGRGVIRTLNATNAGTFTLNQTQNLTVSNILANTANNFVTNGRMRVDNATDYLTDKVLVSAITNMGSGYTTSPVLAANTAAIWTASATVVGAVRVNAGNQYVSLDAVASSVAPTHTTFDVQTLGDGKAWLHVGPVGTIGNAFAAGSLTPTVGTQYFWNGALYICVGAGGPMSILTISGALPFGTTVGDLVSVGGSAFRCVGTPMSATLNYDGVSQTVRSISVVSYGTGITATPGSAIIGGGGTLAVLTSLYSAGTVGPANATATKATASIFTGAVGAQNSNAPSGASGNGVYSATPGASQRGWYNAVPAVGFSAPFIANLVTAQGSGYGVTPPTVSVAGGTLISGTAMVAGDFQVNVADGRVISVYYNGATAKIYSVPPTISLTGGSGTGATIDWGTSYPTATATLSNGTSGQVTGITITNNGYGYATAPTMAFTAAVGGEVGATTPTARLQQLNIRWGFFVPQTTNPNNNSVMAMVPSNNRINAFVVSAGAQTFTTNIEAAALAPIPTFTGNIDMGGSNTVRFSHPDYTGTAGAVGQSITNGTIELSLRGGNTTSTSRTFPLSGGTGATAQFVHTTGLGTGATGFTYTGIRAIRTGTPSGSVSPAGNITGVRGVRIDYVGTGTLVNLNSGRTMQMNWNLLDNLASDNASIFLAEATALTGPWTIRSTAGIAGPLPTTGNRVTATGAPGPYTSNSTMYFAWTNNGFSPPPALAYNVTRTNRHPYNSIASAAKGGDGSGGAFTGWVTSFANDEEQATLTLPGWTGTYQGSAITGIRVHTNGFLQIINGTINFPTNPWDNNMALTTAPNVVAAFWEDLVNRSSGPDTRDNSIIYSITGSSPNRTLTVEWSNMSVFGATTAANLYFQIQLFESTGGIRVNYGNMQLFNGTTERRFSYSMGIKGSYNTAYPTAGQVFTQQYENYSYFSHQRSQFAHYGANGMGVSPEPRSRYDFVPGAYVSPGPPTPTAPANDLKANAEVITALSVFPSNVSWNRPDSISRIYTTRFATSSGDAPCGGGPSNAKDVWFKFTASEVNTTVRIYPSGGYVPRIEGFDNASTSLLCVVGTQGQATDLALTGLTIGDDYFVRVSHDRVGTNAVFSGSVVASGAVSGVSITNGGSGYTIASPTFNGPSGGRFEATGGGGTSFVGAVTAVTAGQVTNGGFDGGNDYVTLPTITVESPDWGITGEFAIVIYAPPINDDCAGAIVLTGVNTLTCTPGTNQILAVSTSSATESSDAIGGCGTIKDDDLWYRFTATGARSRVRVQGNSGFDPALQIWTSPLVACGSKSVISTPAGGCVNATGVSGLEDVEFATNVGEFYWVRVFHAGAGSVDGGTFDICVTTIPDVDVRPLALINPAASTCGSATQQVSVRIQNKGALVLTAGTFINFTVNITGAVVANLTPSVPLPANLAVNDSVTLDLGTFDMSANGTYNFVVSATTVGDGDVSNDALSPNPSRVINIVSAPTYNDGLNTQGGWVIEQVSGTGNWVFTNTAQNNGSTPVVPFREGTGYLYFNSYSFLTATSRAISPCLDLSPSVCSRMTFQMKRDDEFLADNDRVEVRVSTDGGSTFSAPVNMTNLNVGGSAAFASRPYDTTGTGLIVWHTYEVNLAAYVGQTIRLAFDATSEFGNNIMIDDFRLLPGVTDDAQPVSVISPLPNGVCGNTTTSVVVRFRNNSCFPAVNIPYTVNISGPASPSVISGVIASIPASSEVNETVGTITITGNAPLTFNVNTSLPGDEVPSNNAIGPIAVPLRQAPTVTASLADENLVLGFSTTLNASAVLGSPTAGATNSTQGQIDANGTGTDLLVTRNIVLSGFGSLAANQITSLTFNATHTFVSDMEIRLTDPTGVTRILASGEGGAGDNFTGTVFGNSGPSIVGAAAPFTGNFQPQEAFSGFSALAGSANGTWVLEIEDTFDDGTFTSGGGFFLNATIAFPNAITAANYVCPTCPVGFPASAVSPGVSIAYPNNPLGATYPAAIYPIVLTVSDRGGCSVVENLSLNVFTENRWLGVNPGVDNWQDVANWQSSPAPPSSLVKVLIPAGTPNAPNISTSANTGSVIMEAGAILNVAPGATLNVDANWNGGTASSVSNTGTVLFNGPGTQTISGTPTFENIRVSKTAGTLNITGTAAVNGVVTLNNATSSINITGAGKLVLLSTPSGTAKIAPVPSGATIVGNVSMQRYLPHTGNGGWFFLGSPIGGKNFTDWADNFPVMGPPAGFGAQGWPVLSNINTAQGTVFKYVEAQHATYVDTVQKHGWRLPPNENIIPGAGYRVYVNAGVNPNSKFDNTGTVTFGTFNFPTLTRNTFTNCVFGGTSSWASNPCTEAIRGWNLLANPYPAPLNWDASGVGTWTKPAQMNNAFYTWNESTSSYRIYLGSGGSALGETFAPNTNVDPNVIPTSQAFFVKMISGTSANLSVGENAKILTTNGTFTRVASNFEQVKIRLTNAAVTNSQYDGMLRFDGAASYNFDAHKDADALFGQNFGYSFLTDDGQELVLTTVPHSTETKVIPMRMNYNGHQGSFKFSFFDQATMISGTEVYLRDNFLGTLTPLISSSEYAFVAISQDGSAAVDRFEIVISPSSVTGINKLVDGLGIGLYPNPVAGNSSVNLAVRNVKDASASVSITDVLGKVVYTSSMALKANELSEKSLDLSLPAGVYTVKVSSSGKTFTEKLVIR